MSTVSYCIFTFQPGLLSRFSPELDLIVRGVLWNYSIRLKSASFGQRLLFMSYDPNELSKGYKLPLHFIFTVLLQYLKDNVTFRSTHSQAMQDFVNSMEKFSAILGVLVWFRFLKCGQRPTLTSYILGLNNVSYDGGRRREIGYHYITRELIWGGFMVCEMQYVLSFINYDVII